MFTFKSQHDHNDKNPFKITSVRMQLLLIFVVSFKLRCFDFFLLIYLITTGRQTDSVKLNLG